MTIIYSLQVVNVYHDSTFDIFNAKKVNDILSDNPLTEP